MELKEKLRLLQTVLRNMERSEELQNENRELVKQLCLQLTGLTATSIQAEVVKVKAQLYDALQTCTQVPNAIYRVLLPTGEFVKGVFFDSKGAADVAVENMGRVFTYVMKD